MSKPYKAAQDDVTVFWTDGGKLLHRADCPVILRNVRAILRDGGKPVRSYRYGKAAEHEEDANRRTYPPDDALLHSCLERRPRNRTSATREER